MDSVKRLCARLTTAVDCLLTRRLATWPWSHIKRTLSIESRKKFGKRALWKSESCQAVSMWSVWWVAGWARRTRSFNCRSSARSHGRGGSSGNFCTTLALKVFVCGDWKIATCVESGFYARHWWWPSTELCSLIIILETIINFSLGFQQLLWRPIRRISQWCLVWLRWYCVAILV